MIIDMQGHRRSTPKRDPLEVLIWIGIAGQFAILAFGAVIKWLI